MIVSNLCWAQNNQWIKVTGVENPMWCCSNHMTFAKIFSTLSRTHVSPSRGQILQGQACTLMASLGRKMLSIYGKLYKLKNWLLPQSRVSHGNILVCKRGPDQGSRSYCGRPIIPDIKGATCSETLRCCVESDVFFFTRVYGGRPFDIQHGVKQGDILSTMFFNVALECALQKSKEDMCMAMGHYKRLTNIRYTNDLTLYSRSLPEKKLARCHAN